MNVSYKSPLELVKILKLAGIELDKGLSNSEIEQVQARYSFTFPPDLRTLLQTALPISDGFPNWRTNQIPLWQLDILSGILFDVEHNNWWLPTWGTRPKSLKTAIEFVRLQVSKAPKLIPIYSHRYISETPNLPGNPVMSVVQTDIIYYGSDLYSYLPNEFSHEIHLRKPDPTPIRPVSFWAEIIEYNEQSYSDYSSSVEDTR